MADALLPDFSRACPMLWAVLVRSTSMAKCLVVMSGAMAGACVLALVASCTTFTTDAATGVVDAAAEAADGNVPSDGGGDADAEAGEPPPLCGALFCEDFEGRTWEKLWTTTGAKEHLGVTNAGGAVSGTNALDLAITGDSPVILVRPVGSYKHVTLTVRMSVLAQGDGEVDFVNIASSAAIDAPGVHLIHDAASNSFGVEPVGGTSRQLAATFGSFVRVELELDLDKSVFAYHVGDSESGTGALPAPFVANAQSLYVSLGAAFTLNVSKAWHVRFDDVTVDAH